MEEPTDQITYLRIIRNLEKENRDLRRKLQSCVILLNMMGNRASAQAKKIKKSTKLSLKD